MWAQSVSSAEAFSDDRQMSSDTDEATEKEWYHIRRDVHGHEPWTVRTSGMDLAEDILHNGQKYHISMNTQRLPSWYRHELIKSGQKYFQNNIFNMFVAKLSGLLILLASPSIVHVLYHTKKSSKPVTAYKRYMSTIMHMISWYESDLRDPNSYGRHSINLVRRLHSVASNQAGPITQKDLALTQFGFMGFAIIAEKKLGLNGNQDGLIHFWRVIGHFMGIQDRFNLCRGDVECTVDACQQIAKRYFVTNLESPPENFAEMSKALLEGIWPLVVFFNPAAFMEHTRRICGCPPKKQPLLPLIFLYIQTFVHTLLQIQMVSFFLLPIFNYLMWFTISVQNKMPLIAQMTFSDSLNVQ